jgi:hypothetical protein
MLQITRLLWYRSLYGLLTATNIPVSKNIAIGTAATTLTDNKKTRPLPTSSRYNSMML